ncbi:uncharacterized protein LOC129568722 [Sitodiplosis mosellana]|uniref:uncharacterized protein LOC129568722 n=1 Tax=Sitodiplosis mosellana TaxID=263140 RepID=UPI0024445614|nr:uncharacterized protein LOC129568722 [Sitodiplosis mosellana]
MEKRETKPAQSAKYQYIGTFVVNLLSISYGVSGGWASPSIILLMSDETPLPSGKITMEEASWIVSLVYLGGIPGNMVFGFITNRFGRKWPLIIATIPIIISWLLILYAENLYHLYASRLLNGFIGGGLFVVIPLYLSEISIDSVRGVLGSTLILSENVGILLAFTLGYLCDFYTIPKVVIGLTALCAVLICFLPDTPSFLMKQNRIDSARKSIRFYQNLRRKNTDYDLVQMEIKKLQNTIPDVKTERSMKWSDLTTRPARRAILIGVVLMAMNQLCGAFAMLNYTAYVFEEAGSSMSSNESAIVVGIISILGSLISTNLVDRAGRKILFFVSSVGAALGLVTLGTYVMLKSWDYDVEPFNWIPIASFSFVVFIASLGVLNLPFLVISEIFPENIKDFAVSFCMIVLELLTFIVVKWLPFIMGSLGFHGSMFLFAGICLLGEVFIIIFLPETKGKSYEQIMDIGALLIIYTPNGYYLCVARFINGFVGGGGYQIVPLLLAEVANNRIRGTTVSSLVLTENSGILLAFIIGSYCDYYVTPTVVAALTVIFGVLLCFFPGTPTFLEAKKSIRFYQNLREGETDDKLVEIEKEKLKCTVSDANLLTIAFGMTEGWTSPSVLLLTSDESPLPSGKITMEEASWIASLLCLGLFGNIFFCYVINKFGRKKPLLLITVPTIISCLLVIYAPNAYYLCVARFINGFVGGGGYVIVPIYLSEISFDRVRGAIVTSLVVTENFGMLVSYIIGNFYDFYVTPKVMIVLTVIFGVLLCFFPESPTFLLKQNRISEAERSIRFYQNLGENSKDNKLLEIELTKLKSAVCDGEDEKSKENAFDWSDLRTKTVRKAMTIGVILASLNQFSGVATMLNYTATIFQEAGSNLTPNVSTIIIGVILMFSALIAAQLVDRAGRKILFAVSNFGTALGLTVLGVYMSLKSSGYPVEAFYWLPVTCFSFVIFVAALGILSIPFIVLAEIMPEKVKDFNVSVCMTLLWIFAFLTTKYLPFLTDFLGFGGSMFLFAGVCVACELFIMFFMPETKGKSHEEIMELLR